MAQVAELEFVNTFTKQKLPSMLHPEMVRSQNMMRKPHRRTASDVDPRSASFQGQLGASVPVGAGASGEQSGCVTAPSTLI